jgi:FtsX-like permease family
VSRWATLGLGLRLAFSSGRRGRVRLSLTSVGIAFGVGLILGVLGVIPAYLAHDQREFRRYGQELAVDSGTHVQALAGQWRGHDLTVFEVNQDGPGAVPPGLKAVPGPGQVAVSPALARAMHGRHAAELTARVPGEPVATVGPAGLTGPSDLVAWVGVPRTAFPKDDPATRFVGPDGRYVDQNLRIAVELALVGLLIPVLVFVGTVSRLSAASRDRRLAAIRLVGATPRQVRLMVAAETGAAATMGTAIGVLAFVLLRQPVSGFAGIPGGVFGGDIRPPLWQALSVVVGVPVLTIAVSVLALSKVITSPLGVTRRTNQSRAGLWRLSPLAAGLLMLVGAWLDRTRVTNGTGDGAFLLLGGAALTLIGLAVAAAAVSRLAGRLLEVWGRGVASQLAAGRLALDPGASARTVTGAMLVVFAAGWLLAFIPLLQQSESGDQPLITKPGLVVAELAPGSTAAARLSSLRKTPGVRSAGLVRLLDARTPGSSGEPRGLIVADCPVLAQALRSPIKDCAPDSAYASVIDSNSTPVPEPSAGGSSGSVKPGERLNLQTSAGAPIGSDVTVPPDARPRIQVPMYSWGLPIQGDILLPPREVPAAALAQAQSVALVETDGSPAAIEAVRSALWPDVAGGRAPYTLEEKQREDAGTYTAMTRATELGLLLAVLVAAASLAATTADALLERRRALAALVALGTPLRVLRRSTFLQTALPLVLNIGLASFASILASVLYLGLARDPGERTPLPWAGWAAVGLIAIVGVALVTLATLPFLRSAARAEGLHAD